MQVYEALARAIAAEGVTSAFALVGQANMHLVSALSTDSRVSVYHSPHEATALGMAEGYARSSGRPTVCLVTGGAALVNLTLSLVEAVRSQTPLVVVSGRTPAAYRGSPQTFDHRMLAATAGAGYEEITAVSHALTMTRAAFARAASERRPVVLDIASDLQLAEFGDEYAYPPYHRSRPRSAGVRPAADAVRAAADAIGRAERPVILAGAGAVASGALAELTALGEQTGALLATTLPAHGWFDDDPFNIGVAGFFGWPFATDLLRTSDCVIGVGASLNRYTMQDTARPGALSFRAAQTVQISTDEPGLLGDDEPSAVFVQGDARATIAELRELLPARSTGFRTDEVAKLVRDGRRHWDSEARFEVETGLTDPRQLCDLLDAELPAECGVTIGTGHCWAFPIMHLQRWREPQLFAYHFGSIGVASAIGMGGAIGAPDRPMVIVEGDGSVLMNVHNLQTLARYQLPVLHVVLNDTAYGAELHQLAGKGLDPEVSLLPEADIAAVANAFGCTSVVIRSPEEFVRAVRDFLARPRPYVLDCRTSRAVISLPSRRLDYRTK